jgi:hypothetical protein
MASEAEYEYDYSDDEDYPVESDDDDEGMDWEESNPNAAPVVMGGGKGEMDCCLSLISTVNVPVLV